jgi:opacity protein-like surface antigen
MKLSLVGSAIIATFISTAAFAQDETRIGVTANVQNTDENDLEAYGLKINGDNGAFNYGLTLSTGQVNEEIDFYEMIGDLTWAGIGKTEALKFGPTITLSSSEIDDEDLGTAAYAGLAIQSKTENFRIKADLKGSLDDLNNIQNTWLTSLEADYYLTPRTTIETEYLYNEADDMALQNLRLGARYDMTSKTYAEIGGTLTSLESENASGAYIGAGFRF